MRCFDVRIPQRMDGVSALVIGKNEEHIARCSGGEANRQE